MSIVRPGPANHSTSFAWVNPQVLANSLNSGDLDLPTALSQFNAIIREVLKIIEEYSKLQTSSYNESKMRAEKMEKLIAELSEKCQGLQQALLYKEEKYDEKCREVERYKLICELSSRSAVEGDIQNTIPGEDDRFSIDDMVRRGKDSSNHANTNLERDGFEPMDVGGTGGFASPHHGKTVLKHVKLKQPNVSGDLDNSQRTCVSSMSKHEARVASDYLGGPSRPKPSSSVQTIWPEASVRRAMFGIGGINVDGPRVNSGPVPIRELSSRPSSTILLDPNNRVKVELTGQRNEVMSSSRNAVDQMRQKFTEKDLHRQLAGGCWTRISSRRRKEWPF